MYESQPSLLAQDHAVLSGLFWIALATYGVAWITCWLRPALGRWVMVAGLLAHTAALVGRGLAISFFPLTNKVESFAAAAWAVALVAVVTWRPLRLYVVPLVTLATVALSVALTFSLDLTFPPPLMRTIWYPLHVPLSFLAYATWAAAAAAALVWWKNRDPLWLRRIDQLSLQGFGLWSLSMVCGGVWGVLAWGAYFMWDPKIIWSVILWFHYASFIHVRLTPSLRSRPWVRPALAWVGFAWVFVAYVGTSFFFGKSSHAF